MLHKNDNQNLLDLTNAFLTEFFALAKANSTNKTLGSDGYAFNYTLAECLLKSDYVQNSEREDILPLLDMGFAKNIVEGFFHLNIQGIGKKIEQVIENFDTQEEYADYRASDLTVETNTTTEYSWSNKADIEKEQVVKTFNLRNLRSGHKSKAVNTYMDGRLKTTEVYLVENCTDGILAKQPLILSIRYKQSIEFTNEEMTEYVIVPEDEATIQQYRFTADINGFFNVIDHVAAV